ncbi:hypothetical protein AAC387_Pa12g0619 [Persea americana]
MPLEIQKVLLEASENIVEEPPSNLPTEDSVQKIDLGTPDNPRPVFISKNIKDDELPEYIAFLHKFVGCFAWSYAEMPGLDSKIAVHKLNMQEDIKPVKQGQRRFRPDVMDKIEQEVQKLKSVGFIREEQHPEWRANIVPVTKKNGQIRVCIDYRDLNNACPKDEFPLPIPKRAMMKIFQVMQHKIVECYVDDLAVKSKRKEDHLKDLREVFLRLRKHKLRMNPLKCFFGVSSGVDFVWDTEYEAAFEDIKSYLTKPPVLAAPTTGKPFILYIRALNHSLGALLAQENDGRKEAAQYYLSHMLVGAEHRYSLSDVNFDSPIFLSKRGMVLVTKAGSFNARLAKWSILLSQFDFRYVPQKAIKCQTLADFLAAYPLPKDSPLRDDLPDELVYSVEISLSNASWDMYFDGATRTDEKGKLISGIGILFVSPDKYMIQHAFSLLEQCSNNAAEYQALIIGLELALESGITMLEAFGDSQPIVNQMNQKYEIRKPDLLPYYNKA